MIKDDDDDDEDDDDDDDDEEEEEEEEITRSTIARRYHQHHRRRHYLCNKTLSPTLVSKSLQLMFWRDLHLRVMAIVCLSPFLDPR